MPGVFGPWQTIWTRHRRMAESSAWDTVWAVSVASTIARAHQHATNITRHTGGWIELHGTADRAA
jgi:hypothetical protein